jgi:CRISPR/Cas system-associated exonuclease Cas4 (RecB family)
MSLYLSASSIKDYLLCTKKFYYRTSKQFEFTENPSMQLGTVVHSIIEKYWDLSLEDLLSELVNECMDRKLGSDMLEKGTKSLTNFYHKRDLWGLSIDDKIEYSFKLPMSADVFLVGKIDRITKDGILLDWKTESSPPENIDLVPQFIVYDYAYKRLFDRNATIYSVGIYTDTQVMYKRNTVAYNEMIQSVIPNMADNIRANRFSREGMFSGKCFRCPYKEVCLGDSK